LLTLDQFDGPNVWTPSFYGLTPLEAAHHAGAMNATRNTKPFLCSYHHDGCEWSLTVHAYDFEDARARCSKLGFLRLDGEVVARIPAKLGFFVALACQVRNFFGRAS